MSPASFQSDGCATTGSADGREWVTHAAAPGAGRITAREESIPSLEPRETTTLGLSAHQDLFHSIELWYLIPFFLTVS